MSDLDKYVEGFYKHDLASFFVNLLNNGELIFLG